MNNSILLSAQPDDFYFFWQVHLYIESCLKVGFEQNQIHILLYKPADRRTWNPIWEKLESLYPEIKICRYEDKGVNVFLPTYIPVLRPHILWQHFEKYPELSKETILYTDCDILWTKNLDISKYFEDDINYISNASSYMDHKYFERKQIEVKKETNRDFLDEICKIVGITKDIVIKNEGNIGGVQYILKNITSEFWRKVQEDCISIRLHLLEVNKEFYASENQGIQSWCSDLWAVLFNLYYLEREVKVVKELDFAWSSDNIDKLKDVGILHNAGIVGDLQGDIPVFYKGNYSNNKNPYTDPRLYKIYDDEKNKTLCNNYYIEQMIKVKNKYNLI